MKPNPESEVLTDELNVADAVRLQTRNSVYLFTLTNPAARQGMLTGGVFGNSPAEATIIDPLSIRNGLKVRFRIDYSLKSIMMSTSPVIHFEIIRSSAADPRAVIAAR
jgi:hypothetical protein